MTREDYIRTYTLCYNVAHRACARKAPMRSREIFHEAKAVAKAVEATVGQLGTVPASCWTMSGDF